MLKKIISGGQTGADRAALEAAVELCIPTGGTAPKGWRIQNYDGSTGSDPELAQFGLIEHESPEYPPRTRQNVADSDGTLWVGATNTPGAVLTIRTATRLGKPLLMNPTPKRLVKWIEENSISVLNVAGNRLSPQNPDIFERTYNLLMEALG
jgi:hypothetical protein